jgi:hypothetical protein
MRETKSKWSKGEKGSEKRSKLAGWKKNKFNGGHFRSVSNQISPHDDYFGLDDTSNPTPLSGIAHSYTR